MRYAPHSIAIGIPIVPDNWLPFGIQVVADLSDALRAIESPPPFAIIAPLPATRAEGDALLSALQQASPHSAVVLIDSGQHAEVTRYLRNQYPIDLLIPQDRCETTLSASLEQLWQHIHRPEQDYSPYRVGISEINRRILCVDDEEDILNFYHDTLVPRTDLLLIELAARRRKRRQVRAMEAVQPPLPLQSFEVVTARTGERAIRLVREARHEGRPFAAGFFDMRMGQPMDGLDCIRAIRQVDPDMMCAVVTADTDRSLAEIQKVFQDPRSWLYFNKPFTEQELRHSANHLIAGWHQQRRQESIAGFRQSLQRLALYRPQTICTELLYSIVFSFCITSTQSLLQRESIAILMENPDTGTLQLEAITGEFPKALIQPISDTVIRHDAPILQDARSSDRGLSSLLMTHHVRSFAGLPLRMAGALVGILVVLNHGVQDRPLSEDMGLLQHVSEFASAFMTSHQQRSHRPLSRLMAESMRQTKDQPAAMER